MIKVNRDKYTITVNGYMGREEQEEGQLFEYDGMEFYLIKWSKKYWIVREKNTLLLIGEKDKQYHKTRREALENVPVFVDKHKEKMIELIESKYSTID